jgi:GNAT superfamily N-acetyltransferase
MQRRVETEAATPTAPSVTASTGNDPAALRLRLAVIDDAPHLRSLISLSVQELQRNDYSPDQLALAVRTVFTLDTQLITDGTYFVMESSNGECVACGGDLHAVRDDAVLDPETDAARIRAFFVHPSWARRGLGSRLLLHCERAAQAAGFSRFEMAATLTGVPLYTARGYRVVEETSVPLCGSSNLQVMRMARSILESELK